MLIKAFRGFGIGVGVSRSPRFPPLFLMSISRLPLRSLRSLRSFRSSRSSRLGRGLLLPLLLAFGLSAARGQETATADLSPTPAWDLLLSGTTGAYSFVNEPLGALVFYNAGYYGRNTVIANVEGGAIWSGHEVFDRSALSLPSGPTEYVSAAGGIATAPLPWQLDLHATAVGHALAGTGYSTDGLTYVGIGMAPLAELWSGSVATEFDQDDLGSFSMSDESFLMPYKTFFNGDLGKKPDVINSSFGYDDPAGTEFYTRAIDGLARQNSSVAMVFAAGNSGPAPGSVGGAASGYNSISVGALGGTDFSGPASFSSSGPSDFYNPETGETVTAVRATVHIAAPGEHLVLAYYGGTGGTGGVTDPEDPLPTDLYLIDMAGTSFAAPIVAGGVALLKDVAKGGVYLSGQTEALDTRVIRSVLMAGAERTAGWDNGQRDVDGVKRTTQALDYQTGAGAMNLERSVSAYALGTTDVAGLGGGTVSSAGWDFGSVGLDEQNDYLFDTSLHGFDGPVELTISLNWFVNRSFDNTLDLAIDESFANLDLEIWTVTAGVFTQLVASSESLYNNSELLRITLEDTKDYGFRIAFKGVTYDLTNTLTNEEYGVAWLAVPEPSAAAMGLLGMTILIAWRFPRRRRV